MNYAIPLYELDSHYSSKIYNSGKWIDGINIKALEEKIKEFLGVKYAVLTNSGTSALLAAYWVLKDEYQTLYVDPYTFPATYQPARVLNYKVKFTRQILNNKAKLKKVGLNVVTHLYGQPNTLLSNTDNTSFIEDACQSFGAEYKGKKIGTFGKMGCFSFYPTKLLHSCGHGGAVVTNNRDYYKRLKVFIESGRVNGKMTDEIALNLRMDEIKAEYILFELKNYEKKLLIQREIVKEFLKLIPVHQPLLYEDKGNRHVYSIFNMLVKGRDKFREYMNNLGIETLVYYEEDILPAAIRPEYINLTSMIVAIPCRWNLTATEIKKIKNALRSWFK